MNKVGVYLVTAHMHCTPNKSLFQYYEFTTATPRLPLRTSSFSHSIETLLVISHRFDSLFSQAIH